MQRLQIAVQFGGRIPGICQRQCAKPSHRNAGAQRIVATEATDVGALLATISTDNGVRPSVAVVPIETSMIWRFQLPWAQPPVLQRYSAYTPALDGLDAAFYRSKRAPSFILYQSGRSIDGRLVAAEAPRSLLELTCHYRPVDARGTWTLLRRLARSRCGAPSVVRTVTLHNGRQTALDLPEPSA